MSEIVEEKKEVEIHYNLSTDLEIKLSFINRLRVLWNGKFKVRSIVIVDREVKVISSEAGLIINKIFYRKPKSNDNL